MAESVSAFPKLALMTAALLAAAVLAGAAALMLRGDDNAEIQLVIPETELLQEVSSGVISTPEAAVAAAVEELKVYVTGAVNNPGVYQLEEGDRLADALEYAGGPKEDAILDLVNLSIRIVDQAHYHIPRHGETPREVVVVPETAAEAAEATSGNGSSDLVDLNTASAVLLETLPGIGPALAKAIIDYRETNGAFQSVEEITNVARIGPITYEKIRDLVSVGAPR